jgi:hypothetical protein
VRERIGAGRLQRDPDQRQQRGDDGGRHAEREPAQRRAVHRAGSAVAQRQRLGLQSFMKMRIIGNRI